MKLLLAVFAILTLLMPSIYGYYDRNSNITFFHEHRYMKDGLLHITGFLYNNNPETVYSFIKIELSLFGADGRELRNWTDQHSLLYLPYDTIIPVDITINDQRLSRDVAQIYIDHIRAVKTHTVEQKMVIQNVTFTFTTDLSNGEKKISISGSVLNNGTETVKNTVVFIAALDEHGNIIDSSSVRKDDKMYPYGIALGSVPAGLKSIGKNQRFDTYNFGMFIPLDAKYVMLLAESDKYTSDYHIAKIVS